MSAVLAPLRLVLAAVAACAALGAGPSAATAAATMPPAHAAVVGWAARPAATLVADRLGGASRAGATSKPTRLVAPGLPAGAGPALAKPAADPERARLADGLAPTDRFLRQAARAPPVVG